MKTTYVDGEQTELSASVHLSLKNVAQAVTFLRFFVNSTVFMWSVSGAKTNGIKSSRQTSNCC